MGPCKCRSCGVRAGGVGGAIRGAIAKLEGAQAEGQRETEAPCAEGQKTARPSGWYLVSVLRLNQHRAMFYVAGARRPWRASPSVPEKQGYEEHEVRVEQPLDARPLFRREDQPILVANGDLCRELGLALIAVSRIRRCCGCAKPCGCGDRTSLKHSADLMVERLKAVLAELNRLWPPASSP